MRPQSESEWPSSDVQSSDILITMASVSIHCPLLLPGAYKGVGLSIKIGGKTEWLVKQWRSTGRRDSARC